LVLQSTGYPQQQRKEPTEKNEIVEKKDEANTSKNQKRIQSKAQRVHSGRRRRRKKATKTTRGDRTKQARKNT